MGKKRESKIMGKKRESKITVMEKAKGKNLRNVQRELVLGKRKILLKDTCGELNECIENGGECCRSSLIILFFKHHSPYRKHLSR